MIKLYQEYKTVNIKKEIVALTNSKGGTIYIRIKDNEKVLGLDNAHKNVESLSSMIENRIKNDLVSYCNIEIIRVDNKEI